MGRTIVIRRKRNGTSAKKTPKTLCTKTPKTLKINIIATTSSDGKLVLTQHPIAPKKRRVVKIRRKVKSSDTKVSAFDSLPKVITKDLPKAEQSKYNKALCKALQNNRGKTVVKYLLAGGSLAYGNFDGISDAAQEGYLGVFKAMFEQLDPRTFLTQEIINDAIYIADDPELDNGKLAAYLKARVKLLPLKIENENMSGFDAGEDGYYED